MITGKVIAVNRSNGNLNIKVKIYNDDKEIEEKSYLIAENGIEKSVLDNYVREDIKKLKEKLSDVSIKVDDVIKED